MDFQEYEQKATSAPEAPRIVHGDALTEACFALSESAFTLADHVKAARRHQALLFRSDVVDELGAVLLRLAKVAVAIGAPLSEVARSSLRPESEKFKAPSEADRIAVSPLPIGGDE